MTDLFQESSFLLFDGAMGTYYAEKNANNSKKCELENIYNPGVIAGIHREYIDAGAQAIRTNTFSANSISLNCDFELTAKVIARGYEIAVDACHGTQVKIFADIGPIPQRDGFDNSAEYCRIIDCFIKCGAKYFCFETFSEYEQVAKLCRYIKEIDGNIFILTQFALSPDGYTRKGISGDTIFTEMSNLKTVDAVGFNCVSGPLHLYDYVKHLPLSGRVVSIMPNAGCPSVVNERTVFINNPQYFASIMKDILRLGVRIIGGCCGTTPQHIAAIAGYIANADENQTGATPLSRPGNNKKVKNDFYDRVSGGRKVIAVELDPPLDADADFMLEGAKRLKQSGVDIITIADCPLARARADSTILAAKIKREVAVDVIPHLACRDRNLNATKALLLGMHIEGVRNVLVVTGDPVAEVDHNEVKGVFNFNSFMLAGYVRELNKTSFTDPMIVAGALNVNAVNFKGELNRARQKEEKGVSVFFSQPVYSDIAIQNLAIAKQTLTAKILGGILPIVSYRNACFLNNEVPGIKIPEAVIAEYEGKNREESEAVAFKLCLDIAAKIAGFVDGYYIMTPLRKIDLTCKITEAIRNTFYDSNS